MRSTCPSLIKTLILGTNTDWVLTLRTVSHELVHLLNEGTATIIPISWMGIWSFTEGMCLNAGDIAHVRSTSWTYQCNSGVKIPHLDAVGSVGYFLSPYGAHAEQAHKHSSGPQREEELRQNLLVSSPANFGCRMQIPASPKYPFAYNSHA